MKLSRAQAHDPWLVAVAEQVSRAILESRIKMHYIFFLYIQGNTGPFLSISTEVLCCNTTSFTTRRHSVRSVSTFELPRPDIVQSYLLQNIEYLNRLLYSFNAIPA